MKKPLQKSITQWYVQEHNSLSQLNPIRPFEAFVVQVYIDELMFKGTNTPSVVKQLEKFRDFIEDNYLYIQNVIVNVTKGMETSPFENDYLSKTKFEKVLSVYNSYSELEKMVPGRGDEAIKTFYDKINNL